MNENEDERQEQKDDNTLKDNLKQGHKKANTSKFKMLLRRFLLKYALPIMIFGIIVGFIIWALIGAIAYILDLEGDNSVTDVAIERLINEHVTIAKTEDGKYYFKISKELINKYLEELNKADYEGYYADPNPEQVEEKPEFKYDPEDAEIKKRDVVDWFKTDNYNPYIINMIKAEIASSYPKLSEYEGEDGTEDELGNKKDKDGDYVAQGIAEIRRRKMNKDGTQDMSGADSTEGTQTPQDTEQPNPNEGNEDAPVQSAQPAQPSNLLTYLPHEEFSALISANDSTALNYFSFDGGSGILYYATYKEVVVTRDGVESPEEGSYVLQENTVSYKSITNMCSMPYNFLFALLQESGNPVWVTKVVDLLLQDSQVVLMIQDQMNITTFTHKETSYHAQKTVEEVYQSVRGRTENGKTSYRWSKVDENASYTFPVGEAEVSTTVTTTYTNTATVYIEKAHTWCIDFEQAPEANNTETQGEETITKEEHSESDYAGLNYPDSSTRAPSSSPSGSGRRTSTTSTVTSTDTLLESTSEKMDSQNFGWTINMVTEKRINYEKFLGLWKNAEGKYSLGCRFDENGKEVPYGLPDDETAKLYPARDIPQENEQNIDELVELLALHENTQLHEQLMMYYWNIYFGEDVYDVNLDAILDLFDTSTMTSMSGVGGSGVSILKEYIRAWENSGGAPMNADGTMYIIHDDGYGHPTVGYGVDIKNGGYESLFKQMGYPTEIGGQVPVDFVDGLEEKEISSLLGTIKAATSGLNLEEHQIHALVSRAYNCGPGSLSSSGKNAGAIGIRNGKNFVQAYQAYWNQETDDLCGNKTTSANFSHQLYTQYMSMPTTSGGKQSQGLVNRRKSEWTLFQTGYYDRIGKFSSEGNNGGTILQVADKIHKYMEANNYTYSQSNLSKTFEGSKTGSRVTCCATYVSWVLQEAGYIADTEHSDSSSGLRGILVGKGWQEITNPSEVQAGDIIYYYKRHIEIYAGNGKVYNAGSTSAIRNASPASGSVSSMTSALRPPN